MPPVSSGIVTFLFTDIEGSTRLWERQPDAMRSALARHDALLRRTIAEHEGHVFKTVGDAFCAAFSSAEGATAASLAIHRALHAEDWGASLAIRVRIACLSGPPPRGRKHATDRGRPDGRRNRLARCARREADVRE